MIDPPVTQWRSNSRWLILSGLYNPCKSAVKTRLREAWLNSAYFIFACGDRGFSMAGLDDAVLGLFAKWPQLGGVKTRLAAATSPEFAAIVAGAFLADSIERLSTIPVRRVLAFAPDDASLQFAELAGARFELEPQGPGGLGERMARFFSRRFAEGARRVVLLGSDSPTVPLDFIRDAFNLLRDADVVIGPACDGGYYLVGGTSRMPALFADIEYGQPDVLARTMAKLPATA